MRRLSLRLIIALLAFASGIGVTALVHFRRASVLHYEIASRLSDENPQAAQVVTVPDAPELYKPSVVSISPYEIKRLINENKLSSCQRGEYSGFFDFEPIWKKLNLKISDQSGAFPERCSAPAKANIYTLELDDKSGPETLLRLDFGEPYASLYLIFKHAGNQRNAGWKLLGSLPYYYGAPFVVPSHRVVTEGKQRWLAIEYIGGHGAGYGLNFEDWYAVSERGVTSVLTYQTALFVCCGNPGITSRTKVLRVDSKSSVITVSLQFSNSFEFYPSNERLALWTTKRKVTYIKRSNSSEFMIDPLNSEMSEKELDALSRFDLEDDYLQGILKYNYRELANLAAGRDTRRKEWLRNYLDTCNDSAEKRSLQKLLE